MRAVTALFLTAQLSAAQPIARTACGDIVGSEVSGSSSAVWRFAGIQYATAARWALPKPITCNANWESESSTFHATAYGPVCPQSNNFPVPRLLLAIWAVASLCFAAAGLWWGSARARNVGTECLRKGRDSCCEPARYERFCDEYERLKESADHSEAQPRCACPCACCAPASRTCCAVTAALLSLLISLILAVTTEASPVLGREECLYLNVWRPTPTHTTVTTGTSTGTGTPTG